jgi:hypothetical protein
VDFAERGVRARHQQHQGRGPGARGRIRTVLAGMQFSVDPVLAVLAPARGKFDEHRTPVAVQSAPEGQARAGIGQQVGLQQQRQFGGRIRRHAAQCQLDCMAAAGGARIEAADVQVGTRRRRGVHIRLHRGWPDRGRRLRVAVRAQRLAGHDPGGAVRMIGAGAAVHGGKLLFNKQTGLEDKRFYRAAAPAFGPVHYFLLNRIFSPQFHASGSAVSSRAGPSGVRSRMALTLSG